jgi:hypothetical protein
MGKITLTILASALCLAFQNCAQSSGGSAPASPTTPEASQAEAGPGNATDYSKIACRDSALCAANCAMLAPVLSEAEIRSHVCRSAPTSACDALIAYHDSHYVANREACDSRPVLETVDPSKYSGQLCAENSTCASSCATNYTFQDDRNWSSNSGAGIKRILSNRIAMKTAIACPGVWVEDK